ncbi:MAG TPA: hypothetical protein VNA28_10285 [Solirubrobacteraceae bacterium]|nr:hypothetical protein [Solirubrobacteraceae bacterium]
MRPPTTVFVIRPVSAEPCRAATLVHLRLPAGSRVRATVTFNGNAKLKPRAGKMEEYRVR